MKNNRRLFVARSIILEYKDSDIFFAELYGYDGNLKKTGKSPNDIANFLEVVDNMQMEKEHFSNNEQFSQNIISSENAFYYRFG